MCFLNCLLRSAAEDQPLLIDLHVVVLELFHGVLLLDLGVENMHNGTILQQHFHHPERRCFSHIASVLLKSEAEDRYLLVCNSVEEAGDYLVSKVFLLVLVHIDDLLPVLCAFVQAFALANVHQVQDVLLEARTTEAHGSPKELRTDPRICADSPRDLKFSDVPNGVDGIRAIPTAGLAQILAFFALVELAWMPASKYDGDYGVGYFGTDIKDPEEKTRKLNVELNNGRAAMFGILGTMMHDCIDGNPFIFIDQSSKWFGLF